MKRPIYIPITVVAALISGYVYYKKQHPDFTYAGTLEAETVDISPGVASPIDAVLVKEGDTVKVGQRLVSLACPDIRVSAGQAQSDLSRNQRLFDAGSLAASNFDRSRYASRDVQVKLSWCEVSAPIRGTVLSVYRRAGEWARPGQNLLTLADLSEVYAYFYVPQSLLPKIKLGQAITGSLSSLPGKNFAGTVSHIRPEAEFTPKNVQTREERDRLVYGVKITFANPGGELKPGMPIEAELPR